MGGKDKDCSGELHLFCIFLSFYLFTQKYCYAIHNITTSQVLYEGQTLISPNQIFELGFFSLDATSGKKYFGIWYYNQTSRGDVVWVANRENPLLLITDSRSRPPASLRISSNGNLVLVDGNNSSIWSTNIHVSSSNSLVAALLDNGNFVLKGGTSEGKLWQSFGYPCNSLLPGNMLRLNGKTLESRVLTSWKRDGSDPSPGDFTLGIDRSRTPPQVYIWRNGTSSSMTPHWRSGPWDKTKFIGVAYKDTTYQSLISVSENDEESVDVNLKSYHNSVLQYLFISSKGVLKRMVNESGNDKDYWQTAWEEPKTDCDFYGVCGSFGVCRISKSPLICECLDGFVPKSHKEWNKGNWSRGCVRRTKLLCEKNASSHGDKKDGFQTIGRMKLPDFYDYVPREYDTDSCRSWCLNNCSCQAFAYVNNIGCLVWSERLIDMKDLSSNGEVLFLRLAHSELAGGQQPTMKILISLAAVCTSGILVAIIFSCYRWRTNQKRNSKEITENFDLIHRSDCARDIIQFSKEHISPEPSIYDLNSILIATNHFSIKNKLGQGGFGPVYKGELQTGKEIAVKRLSSSSGQGIQEFKNEMILISKLQHRNLVRLMGCCVEKEEKILIYEFMPNKSLDTFLFDPQRRAELSWCTRFNIIQGVAKGLVYLHRDSRLRVIHRDLKASNILLDEKKNPKISDLGLARLFQGTLDLANTHRVVGTLGYMSPEYAMGGIFSEKSDFFSFGILILEIVSGKKNTSFHYYDKHLSLIAYTWQLWSESRGLDLLDQALADSSCSLEVMRCIHVGLLCVQDHAPDRPSMPDVVSMLNNETDRPQPKQPFFTFQISSRSDLPLKIENICSLNEATVSMIEGR